MWPYRVQCVYIIRIAQSMFQTNFKIKSKYGCFGALGKQSTNHNLSEGEIKTAFYLPTWYCLTDLQYQFICAAYISKSPPRILIILQ